MTKALLQDSPKKYEIFSNNFQICQECEWKFVSRACEILNSSCQEEFQIAQEANSFDLCKSNCKVEKKYMGRSGIKLGESEILSGTFEYVFTLLCTLEAFCKLSAP